MRATVVIFLAGVFMVMSTVPAGAQPAAVPGDESAAGDDQQLFSTGALDTKIAVMSFDALGLESELVARLESLFRMELERLSRQPMPSPRKIAATIRGNRRLRRCSGENKCLAQIGLALGVDAVVSGNVAALGDSYILDIKVVDAKTGKEVRRLASDPLRGNPDELIEAVRVAAYRLLAPDELRGSISVLTDLVGATVKLDGKEAGKTPLPGPIYKLELGEHKLEVVAEGYIPFNEAVQVRFQKSTRVVVRMATVANPDQPVPLALPVVRKRPAAKSWYSSPWFYVGVGAAAAVVGGYVGYRLGRDPVIDCGANPQACVP